MCVGGSYRYQMVGFFSARDKMHYKFEYAFAIAQVGFNFRLFSSEQKSTVTIIINGAKQFTQVLDHGSEIDISNATDYLIIPADKSSTVDTFLAPIRADLNTTNVKSINIEFYVEGEFTSQ